MLFSWHQCRIHISAGWLIANCWKLQIYSKCCSNPCTNQLCFHTCTCIYTQEHWSKSHWELNEKERTVWLYSFGDYRSCWSRTNSINILDGWWTRLWNKTWWYNMLPFSLFSSSYLTQLYQDSLLLNSEVFKIVFKHNRLCLSAHTCQRHMVVS